MLIIEKIEKIKKKSVDFFKNFRQFSVIFNDPEAITKEKIEKKKNSVDFFKS